MAAIRSTESHVGDEDVGASAKAGDCTLYAWGSKDGCGLRTPTSVGGHHVWGQCCPWLGATPGLKHTYGPCGVDVDRGGAGAQSSPFLPFFPL